MKIIVLLLAIVCLCTSDTRAHQKWFGHYSTPQLSMLNAVMHQYETDSLTTIVTTRGGEEYTGRVLYAGDSSLVIWQSNAPYDWSLMESFGKWLHVSDICRIAFVNEGHFWSRLAYGFGTGFRIGASLGSRDSTQPITLTGLVVAGVLGVVLAVPAGLLQGIKGAIQGIDDSYTIDGDVTDYQAILLELRQRSLFSTRPPPELQSLVR